MQFFAGHKFALPVEVADEMLQPVQAGGVHARVCQTERLGITLVAIKAGELNGQQADICCRCDTQLPRKGVHGASDAPCAGAAFQQHQPGAANDGGFFHKSRLGNGVALTGGRIIVPVDFHVIFDDLALPLSHTGKPPF